MARIPRILIENKHQGESTVYHVMSRTALDGFPMKDEEKDYLLTLFKHYGKGDRFIVRPGKVVYFSGCESRPGR